MVSRSDIEVIPEDTGFNDGGTAASIGIQNNSDKYISITFAPAPNGNVDTSIAQDNVGLAAGESGVAELSWSESDVSGAQAIYLKPATRLVYDESQGQYVQDTGPWWVKDYLWPDTIYNSIECSIVDDSVDPGGSFEFSISIDNFSSVSSEIAYRMSALASEFTVVTDLQEGEQVHTFDIQVPEGVEADQISVSGYPTYVPVTPPEA